MTVVVQEAVAVLVEASSVVLLRLLVNVPPVTVPEVAVAVASLPSPVKVAVLDTVPLSPKAKVLSVVV